MQSSMIWKAQQEAPYTCGTTLKFLNSMPSTLCRFPITGHKPAHCHLSKLCCWFLTILCHVQFYVVHKNPGTSLPTKTLSLWNSNFKPMLGVQSLLHSCQSAVVHLLRPAAVLWFPRVILCPPLSTRIDRTGSTPAALWGYIVWISLNPPAHFLFGLGWALHWLRGEASWRLCKEEGFLCTILIGGMWLQPPKSSERQGWNSCSLKQNQPPGSKAKTRMPFPWLESREGSYTCGPLHSTNQLSPVSP